MGHTEEYQRVEPQPVAIPQYSPEPRRPTQYVEPQPVGIPQYAPEPASPQFAPAPSSDFASASSSSFASSPSTSFASEPSQQSYWTPRSKRSTHDDNLEEVSEVELRAILDEMSANDLIELAELVEEDEDVNGKSRTKRGLGHLLLKALPGPKKLAPLALAAPLLA